ncbi:EamA family transporter [Candidatus Micrarchaeota archaeon]|nr:EamA family transporter [Candidatus Micrarchaeota archaeon]
MAWFLFALVSAAAHAGYNLSSKQLVSKVDPYVVAALVASVAAFFSWAVVLATGIPALGEKFWMALGIEVVIESLALGFYLKALEKTDVSLAVPLLALTPALLLVTSPVITGESISSQGVLGVGLAVVGTYVLAMDPKHKGLLSPFSRLASDSGMRWMLLTAMMYSLTANYYKLVVVNSNAVLTSAVLESSAALVFSAVALIEAKRWKPAKKMIRTVAASGFLASLGGIALATALTTGLTPLVISIRRLSIPATVLLGHRVLSEGQFRQRMLASLILVAGAVLILTA